MHREVLDAQNFKWGELQRLSH